MNASSFRATPRFGMRVVEAAPARRRIAALMSVLLVVFGALGVRVIYLGLEGSQPAHHAVAPIGPVTRAPLLDRTGAILAATTPSLTLVARPREVWRPEEVADALSAAVPSLDRAVLLRRLTAEDRALVYLKRDLTEAEHARVFALGLPGVGFEDGLRRRYPSGTIAAHLLGGTTAELRGVAGAERLLDARLMGRGAGAVRLSLDLRIQHALERELAAAMSATSAQAAAGVLLDGRTGETLALVSLPSFDLNAPPPGDDPRRLNRAVQAVYEPGSVIKPLIWAAALDAGLASTRETFAPDGFTAGGLAVADMDPSDQAMTLAQAMERSSNVVAARLAERLGPARVAEALARAGLTTKAAFPLSETAAPIGLSEINASSAAAASFGYGFATPLIAVAEAFTVFCNEGARVSPTLLATAPGDPIAMTPVFGREATLAVLAMMQATVQEGTARRAGVGGVSLAGKTGTAEKPRAGGGYDPDRMLSSFAGVFPAENPRYVLVVGLDEPARTAAAGGQATGGAVAAPVAGRVLARIAPALGISSLGLSSSGASPRADEERTVP